MRIVVDGDACPVKAEIFEVARILGVTVILVASVAHEMPTAPGVDLEVVRVDAEPQAADLAIMNRTRAADVVVTGDYGLACMVLGRGARVLGFRGQRYDDHNIDTLMAQRHVAARARRAGVRQRGPKAFTAEDRQRFQAALRALLDEPPGDAVRGAPS